MRIVIVNNYTRVTGGADLHCLELAKGLRDRGHQVVFVATAHKHNVDQNGIFVPTTVTRETRAEITGIRAAKVACSAIWNRNAATATKILLDSFPADIVHVHKLYPQLSVAPVVVAAERGIPIVQTVHDYEFISASAFDDAGSWFDRDEERFAYRALNTVLFGVKRLVHAPRVDSWISVSRSTARAYRKRDIVTTVLPNFTEPCTEEPLNYDDRKGVLFLGRLSEEKGVRHLFEVARRAPQISVVIAGKGPLEAEAQHAAESLENLTYLGWLEQAAKTRELISARLVVVPSLWREPAGLSALEAMAAGTPLVVYDTGGLAEYVADAGAGVITSPSVASLTSAITSLYNDRNRWESFSSDARDAVQRDHTLAVYLDRLEQVYNDSCGS
jgi:glycosyltransferase involved in cell wall biosynthesis